MSATGNYMSQYITNYKHIKIKKYKLPIEYKFINNLTFFSKDITLEKFIEESITKKEKSIFFIQSAEKAYKLYKKYKRNCLFNCSKNNDKYYKYVNGIKINKMLANEKFDKEILVTTTCMDAGVNIIDTDVKHIICDIKDIGTLIQCIGRKRQQDKQDKINVYIKAITNKQLGGMKSQLRQKIAQAEYFRTNGLEEYIKKYPRQADNNNILYDIQTKDKNKCSKKINMMMYFKCKTDINIIDQMIQYRKYGYCKYVAKLFGFYNKEREKKYRLIDEQYEETLEQYLNNIMGNQLFKKDRKELINKINLRDNRNRQQKSIGVLNKYLEENKIPYIILSKQIKKNNKLYTIWTTETLLINK